MKKTLIFVAMLSVLCLPYSAMASTLDQSNTTGAIGVGFGDTLNGRDYMCQGFIPTGSNVVQVAFYDTAVDTSTDIGYKMWIDTGTANSFPNGTVAVGIGGATELTNNEIVTSAITTYDLSSVVTLTPSSQYTICWAPWNTTTHAWVSSYHDWNSSTANPYANGKRVHLDGSFATPTNPDAGNNDIQFQTYTGTGNTILKDAITDGGDSAAVSSKTVAHVTGTLTNGAMLVSVGMRDATSSNLPITSCTYNGVTMTKLRNDDWNTSTFAREEIYYLANPASGTHNAVCNTTGSVAHISMIVSTWSGVDQTSVCEVNAGTGTQTATATSFSTSVTPVTNNNVIYDSYWQKDSSTPVPAAGQTALYKVPTNVADDFFAASYKRQVTAGATTMGWSWTTADGYAESICVLKPASTATISSHAQILQTGSSQATQMGGQYIQP